MIIPLANLLDSNETDKIIGLIGKAKFADGKLTAGWAAREIKNNEQLIDGPEHEQINQIIQAALGRNELFQITAFPRYVRPILVSKTPEGGDYGAHVDNPIMLGPFMSRTDISMTVFLSDPDSYVGGDLVMETASGERRFRMGKGSAVMYSSTSLHRVEKVTKGVRLVACTWIQSRIRHGEQREILFDIDKARREIFKKDGKTHVFDLLSKSHANLARFWSDI